MSLTALREEMAALEARIEAMKVAHAAELAARDRALAILRKEGDDMLASLQRARQNAEHALGNYYLALEAIAVIRDGKPAPATPPVLHA